jgi:superfamily II DNA or RNA helicase
VVLDLHTALSDATIRRSTGGGAFARGVEYVRAGMVASIDYTPDVMSLTGTVNGNAARPYVTHVELASAVRSYAPPTYPTSCTCPVRVGCKHAAALMISAREMYAAEHAAPAVRHPAVWERQIESLISRPGSRVDAPAPLALQFEVSSVNATGWTRANRSQLPVISMRPLMRGRSGKWVRTGASWRDVRYALSYGKHDREQVALLQDIARLEADHYAYSMRPTINLQDVSRSLWPLLDRAGQTGLALVSSQRGNPTVELHPERAIAGVDLTRDPRSGDVVVQPRIELDGEPVSLDKVIPIGQPAHGYAVSSAAGDAMELVQLEATLTHELDRFVRQAGQLRVPADDVPRFLETYYPRLRRTTTVRSHDGSVDIPVVKGPRLRLAVSYEDTKAVDLEWGFTYEVGSKRLRIALFGADESLDGRDREAEARLLARLALPDGPIALQERMGGVRRLIPTHRLRGFDTIAFTEQTLPMLRERSDIELDVIGDEPDFRFSDAAPEISVSTTDTDDADWFDLGITVTVDGHDVPFADLIAALTVGESHLLLSNGTYFPLDRPEFEMLRRLLEEAQALTDQPPNGLRVTQYQAGFWGELVSLGVVDAQSSRWAEVVRGLLALDEVPAPPAPADVEAELRPYQLDGYRWLRFLWDHGLGGVLADDMGLGKTLQTLTLVASARGRGEAAPFLIVAPTSVVSNWAAEAQRFTPGLRVVTIHQTEAKRGMPLAKLVAGADLVVTSYALFRLDETAYRELPWAALVLDEAQYVKNHQAKTYQCARKLQTPFKLAITGTPLENGLMDLWSMLSIVAPGLFPHPKKFADYYAKPIEHGGERSAELLASLRRRIRPLMLRRTKEEVATELPPKQESVASIELSPRHRKIYDTHLQRERQKILGLVDDLDKNRFTILRSLTLLRQLSLDPALVDGMYDYIGSAKIDHLLDQMDEIVGEGHRALVFSQFTGFLRRVRARLDASGIKYAYLDGRTRKRAETIDSFKRGDVSLFLISLKAGGFGLNLTEADYVFVLDPWWNPAVEAQAVDRTHRIGQTQTVMVYRLVSEDTIETKVMELKARKEKLFASVMDDNAAFGSALTADDIRGLFA